MNTPKTPLLLIFLALLSHICAAQSPGTLITTWANQGKTIIDVNDIDDFVDLTVDSADRSVALARTGKWVNGQQDFDITLAALLPDGSADLSFGVNGFVTTDLDTFPSAEPVALQQQADGKLVVLGEGRPLGQGSGAWVLQRYLYDGTPDPTFGTNGEKAFYLLEAQETPRAMDLQDDGKIVVAGATFDTAGQHNEYPVVARLLPNGDFDTTFGNTGRIALNFSSGTFDLSFAGNVYSRHVDGGFVEGLLVQPDGKILCSGSYYNGVSYQSMLYRLMPNGNMDTTFGSNGIVIFDLSPGFKNLLTKGIILPSGKALFLVTRGGTFGDTDMLAIEVSPDGVLSFLQFYDMNSQYDKAQDILMSTHGQPMLVGYSATAATQQSGGISDYFALTRIQYNGGWQQDGSFGNSGYVLADVTAGEECGAETAANFSQHRLLVGGYTSASNGANEKDLVLMLFDNSDPLSIGENTFLPWSIYPNPATESITVDFGPTPTTSNIEVIDASGRVVTTVATNVLERVQIDVSALAPGLYFLRSREENKARGISFIVR